MKRYLPLLAIAAAAAIVVVALTRGGSSGGAGSGGGADAPASAHARKAVQRNPRALPPVDSTQKVGGPHDRPVPILMYHVTKAAPAGTPYPELWVSPADFRGQMAWLASHGYTGVTLRQLFRYWDDGYALPAKPVVISFDDGYPSQDKVARKALAAHRWPGVLFLELNNVDNPQTAFTARMVREMIASGWEIDSHTISHPDLTTIGAAELKRELSGSRRRIKREFGQPADFFCYPAGRYDDAVVAAVKAAGYRGATTTDEGIGRPGEAYVLKRVRIDGGDGVAGFAAKVRQAGG